MNILFKSKKISLLSLLLLIFNITHYTQSFVSYHFLINDAGKMVLLLGDKNDKVIEQNNKMHIEFVIEMLKSNNNHTTKQADCIIEFAQHNLHMLRQTGQLGKGRILSLCLLELIKYVDTTVAEQCPIKLKAHDQSSRGNGIIDPVLNAITVFLKDGNNNHIDPFFKLDWLEYKNLLSNANENAIDQRFTLKKYFNDTDQYLEVIKNLRDQYPDGTAYYNLFNYFLDKQTRLLNTVKGYFKQTDLETKLDVAILNLFDNCSNKNELIEKVHKVANDILVNMESNFFVADYLNEILKSQMNSNTLVLVTYHQAESLTKFLTNLGYRVIAQQINLQEISKTEIQFHEHQDFILDLAQCLDVFIAAPYLLETVNDKTVVQALKDAQCPRFIDYKMNTEKLRCCNACSKIESPDNKLFNCSICKKVCYCNANCQRSNWEIHKRTCNKLS